MVLLFCCLQTRQSANEWFGFAGQDANASLQLIHITSLFSAVSLQASSTASGCRSIQSGILENIATLLRLFITPLIVHFLNSTLDKVHDGNGQKAIITIGNYDICKDMDESGIFTCWEFGLKKVLHFVIDLSEEGI